MPKVLTFNIDDPGKLGELSVLALRLNFTLIPVPRERQGCLIGDLLYGRGTDPVQTASFDDEMLVMSGFEHGDLNFLLNELIRTDHRVALKAVVTAINVQWTAAQLCLELKKENLEMKRNTEKGAVKKRIEES